MFSHITGTSAAVAMFRLQPAAPLQMLLQQKGKCRAVSAQTLAQKQLSSPLPLPELTKFCFSGLSLTVQTGSQEPLQSVLLTPSFHISLLSISAPLLHMPLCRSQQSDKIRSFSIFIFI